MDGLRAADVAVFRWINRDWSHPVLDDVMGFLSGNPYFVPASVTLALILLWRGGRRGIVYVIVLGICVGLANELLVEPLKAWVARARPFVALPDVLLRVGKGSPQASMPSGHALLSALAATVSGWYYPRLRVPVALVALGVGLSRAYNGVHFPSDILVGWTLGVSAALGLMHLQNWVWRRWAPRWVPQLARRVPSLLHFPKAGSAEAPSGAVEPADPPAASTSP